ncbi:Rha family transcriptional regulator [Kozakia baliensis]|uniref:Rha family transcriptional regulator n=1 Tax=Kozakia baliensis TaxID=153496 RepID=UPI0009E0636C|nr:Rha family transcriptional regulator [Kozakia baliensis]
MSLSITNQSEVSNQTGLSASVGVGMTMSSREIAELTGKDHKHVRRDIEKMFSDLGEDGSKFGRIYHDAYGREQNEYALPQNLTYTLVAGYRTDLRLKIINRWMELEHGAKPKASRKRRPAFDVAYRRLLAVAETLPGFDANQKVLMASRGTFELTGVNPLELMGAVSIAAPTEDNYKTPTELGKQFHMTGQSVNRYLAEVGLQVHTPGSATGSDWTMTDNGLAYGRMFDTTRKYGKGSQQQLKWKPATVEFLRPFAKQPEAVS